jgi:hypothetical protein
MKVEVKILKGIPVEQIDKFEDRVVYNTALATREYVKSRNAYPYLSGRLARAEIASPIAGYDKAYGLRSGVDYAKYVWPMKDVNWTNPSTKPQWYYSAFKEKGYGFLINAVIRSKKEI